MEKLEPGGDVDSTGFLLTPHAPLSHRMNILRFFLLAFLPLPVLAQTAPTISSIPNRSTVESTVSAVTNFTVGDLETPAADLIITAQSSDPVLIPNANIAIGGSGTSRTVTITPTAALRGSATITLTVTDGDLQSTSSFFLFTVNPLYRLPEESIPDIVMNDDTTVTINYQLGNAAWVPSVTRTNTTLFRSVGTGATSDIRLQGTGTNRTLRLRPAPGRYGESFISITINGDPAGATTSTFKVTVRPVALPDNLLAIPDQTSTLNVLQNDTRQADGSIFTLQSFTPPAHGSMVIGSGGKFLRYTPQAGYLGEDEFTYTVQDSLSGYTFTGTGYITVSPQLRVDTVHVDFRANIVNGEWFKETRSDLRFGPLNAAGTTRIHGGSINPTLLDFDEIVVQASPASYTQLSPTLDPVAFSFLGVAPGESLWILPQGSKTGVAWPGINTEGMPAGTIASYTPTGDPRATTNAAWVRFEMVDTRMPADGVFAMWDSNLVHWDSIDGINGPSEVSIGGNVSDTFWTNAGSHAHMNWTFTKSGRYEIDFRVRAFIQQSGNLVEVLSSVSTLVFDVVGTSNPARVETPPTLRHDVFTLQENQSAAILSVLANDSSAPDFNEAFSITAVTQGAHGSTQIASDGQAVSYSPNVNFNGMDSFTYTVTDEHGGSAMATVSVTITGENDPPVFSSHQLATAYETATTISLAELLTKITDPEGDAVSISAAGPASAQGGSAVLQGGSILYTPPAGFSGTDSFPVTFQDIHGAPGVGTVTVVVGSNPNPGNPESNNPQITLLPDGDIRITFQGIPGVGYAIQRSIDLSTWTHLTTVMAGENGLVTFTDDAPPQPSAFYRLATT